MSPMGMSWMVCAHLTRVTCSAFRDIRTHYAHTNPSSFPPEHSTGLYVVIISNVCVCVCVCGCCCVRGYVCVCVCVVFQGEV